MRIQRFIGRDVTKITQTESYRIGLLLLEGRSLAALKSGLLPCSDFSYYHISAYSVSFCRGWLGSLICTTPGSRRRTL